MVSVDWLENPKKTGPDRYAAINNDHRAESAESAIELVV